MKTPDERISELEKRVNDIVRLLEVLVPRKLSLEEQHCLKMAARTKAKES
jgi:hypothetical protein